MNKILDAVILILDGIPDKNGDFFDSTTEIQCDTPDVPITDMYGGVIGVATPIPNFNNAGGPIFRADLKFFESLMPYIHLHKPCFTGQCLERISDHVTKVKLLSVMISTSNTDNRIPDLGSYQVISINDSVPVNPECVCPSLLQGHEDSCDWMKYRQNNS